MYIRISPHINVKHIPVVRCRDLAVIVTLNYLTLQPRVPLNNKITPVNKGTSHIWPISGRAGHQLHLKNGVSCSSRFGPNSYVIV